MNCREFEEGLLPYVYGEAPPERRAAMAEHLAGCGACRGRLDDAQKFHELLSRRRAPEPSPELLAQCRRALNQAIEDQLNRVTWRGLRRDLWSGLRALPGPRGATALALVVLGFGLGWTLRPAAEGQRSLPSLDRSSPLSTADLAGFHISGIRQVERDPQTGGVKITVDAERRVTLNGSLNNPRIRQILVDAVKSYDNPGIRRDTLDALRQDDQNPAVRSALLYAMAHDPNVGVRLDALESVRTMPWSPEIERAVLNAVEDDSNPGVRVEAVDILTRHASPNILPALRHLAASDRNPYVRFECAKAVHQLMAPAA
jgi:hypothetical protein